MPTATIVSFRLGGPDGVSVEAAKWATSLRRLGWATRTIAGAGAADHVVPGLGLEPDDQAGPDPDELAACLRRTDVTIVENLCSLPLNPVAAARVAEALRGRPALLHHHDLPWQRARFRDGADNVPDDPAWRHVTINDLSRDQLADRGIKAVTIRNAFDVDASPGDRDRARHALDVLPNERLVLQPTRAIPRKNIPAAIAVAEAVGATFWLLGPAEEGYDDELARLITMARTRVIHGGVGSVEDAYAASDLVTFPSLWEGFGNPVVESAIYRRPLAIGDYPVSHELRRFGFRWLPAADLAAAQRWFEEPDLDLLDHNHAVAQRWFSLDVLDASLADVLSEL